MYPVRGMCADLSEKCDLCRYGQEANIPKANCKKIAAKADVQEATDREMMSKSQWSDK